MRGRGPQSYAGGGAGVLVNGRPGLVWEPHGRPELVLMFTVGADRLITSIDVIASPDRVRALNLADLPG